MKKLRAYRLLQFYLFFISLSMLAASFYFQYIKELSPCPLCLMQRLATIGLMILFFIGIIRTRPGQKGLFFFQAFFSLAGIYFAARQLWVMHHPSETASTCLPQLQQMIHMLPVRETLKILVLGSDACSEPQWMMFGLSMPGWSLVYFLVVFFLILLIYFIFSKKNDSIHRKRN